MFQTQVEHLVKVFKMIIELICMGISDKSFYDKCRVVAQEQRDSHHQEEFQVFQISTKICRKFDKRLYDLMVER